MAADVGMLLAATQKLREAVRSSRAINLNKIAVRDQARRLVETYFRETRPRTAQFAPKSLSAELDGNMQQLLKLANGVNAKASYTSLLRSMVKNIESLVFNVELALSELGAGHADGNSLTDVERRIHATLSRMLPAAANSYMQAIEDIVSTRHSYRGPAIELREAVREVLDHMAPDANVIAMTGYKQNKDTSGPTMAQKAKYIMRQRQRSETSAKPTLEAADLVDETTAKIVRSTYQSGSISVHVSPSRAEVQHLKMHVDSVLAALLNIFA